MMGLRVRVTQAAPNFVRKIKWLDQTIRAVELETLLFAKPLRRFDNSFPSADVMAARNLVKAHLLTRAQT